MLAVLGGEVLIVAAAWGEGTPRVSMSKWRGVFVAGGSGRWGPALPRSEVAVAVASVWVSGRGPKEARVRLSCLGGVARRRGSRRPLGRVRRGAAVGLARCAREHDWALLGGFVWQALPSAATGWRRCR